MTYCKLLARKDLKNGKTVPAYEYTEKYSTIAKYEISVSNSIGFEIDSYKASKTTWKKKFDSVNN